MHSKEVMLTAVFPSVSDTTDKKKTNGFIILYYLPPNWYCYTLILRHLSLHYILIYKYVKCTIEFRLYKYIFSRTKIVKYRNIYLGTITDLENNYLGRFR